MRLFPPNRLPKNSGRASARSGLTLFELLTVMMILAILVSLVIGLGRHADLMAKRHHAVADLGRWQEAIYQYYADLGEYPSNTCNGNVVNLLNVRVPIGGSTTSTVYVQFGEKMPTTLNAITNDPWGHGYQYVAPTNRAPQSFDLYSFGPLTNIAADDIRFQP